MAGPKAPVLDVTGGARQRGHARGGHLRAPRSSRTSSTRRCAPSRTPSARGRSRRKSRGLVSGGRSKPWRQKGTGRARAGTIRAAQFTGGGHVFAKVPRNFELKVNRKAARAALRSALAAHAEAGTSRSSTPRRFAGALDQERARADRGLGPRGAACSSCMTDEEVDRRKSFRNLERVAVVAPGRARGRRRRLGALAARQRGGASAARREGPLMHAGQIVLAPVVTEKSYHGSVNGIYTFRVHPDAHKTADPPGGRGALRGPRRAGQRAEGAAEAEAPRDDQGHAAGLEEGDRRS